jgi:hypothetical protein
MRLLGGIWGVFRQEYCYALILSLVFIVFQVLMIVKLSADGTPLHTTGIVYLDSTIGVGWDQRRTFWHRKLFVDTRGPVHKDDADDEFVSRVFFPAIVANAGERPLPDWSLFQRSDWPVAHAVVAGEEHAFGWPLVWVMRGSYSDGWGPSSRLGCARVHVFERYVDLPVRVIWRGVLGNVVVSILGGAVGAALLCPLLHRFRRCIRRDPGACGACGYTCNGFPRCPECGTPLSR